MSLKVENITFRYMQKHQNHDEKPILDRFNAEFPSGKVTALIGDNGTGKTTLARIIMGILKPEEGRVLLDQEPIDQLTMAQRGKKIGYVMQNPARQIFSMTVEEEMTYGLKNIGLSEEAIAERSDRYLKRFGLEQYRQTLPFLLSQGEKQRLILAAILAMEPEYLILDEPTASMDRKHREILGGFLQKLDCGVLLITHDREFVDRYSSNQVEMEQPHGSS